MEHPWTQKYEPTMMDEIVGNTSQVNMLRGESIVSGRNIPNMIICGPHGTGKSCILKLLQANIQEDAILKVNVIDSKNKNLNNIRNIISNFSKLKVNMKKGSHKIVIIDDADFLNANAQHVLRSIMDVYVHSTRFIFTCNNSIVLIEPIQSRCSIVRLEKLRHSDMMTRLLYISRVEKIQYIQNGIDAIICTSNGDMRKAINDLQMVHCGMNLVSEENVYKLCDIPNRDVILSILNYCRDGEFDQAMLETVCVCEKGYSCQDIIDIFMKVCQDNTVFNIDGDRRFSMMCVIVLIHSRISEGLDTSVQIMGLISKLCDI